MVNKRIAVEEEIKLVKEIKNSLESGFDLGEVSELFGIHESKVKKINDKYDLELIRLNRVLEYFKEVDKVGIC